ncbi:hypothetical protein CK203_042700 [Vitis vinifera]|uniref:Uncharacterized protein n=1 Tax=Vitis vinifera TaxID=29760 RepID=A0A438DKR7_VITVI|nr:hypothetical protein CK203_079670 [Vitis vinifera]RVW92431.1 hypothetical protein CK203_042700 [Vitis vinifera]
MASLGFDQGCCNLIKKDCIKVFSEFHDCGQISKSTNATFISLFPKKGESEGISNLDPLAWMPLLRVENFWVQF